MLIITFQDDTYNGTRCINVNYLEWMIYLNMGQAIQRYWILISTIILLAGGAWIWVSKAPPGSTTSEGIPAPRVGFLAPDFTLQTLEGDTVTLSELRGHPLLINIWASWCSPCKAEMPALQQVYEAYKDYGFLVLAVNTTYQDDRASAVAFVEDIQLTFPILFDLDGSVSRQYQSRALPTSFFVDKDGVIQEVVVGGPMSEALLNIRVQELLDLD